MLRKFKHLALLLAVCACAFTLAQNPAVAASGAKYYDAKQKKWVPLSENPVIKRNMEMRKKMIEQNRARAEANRKRRAEAAKAKKAAGSKKAEPKKQAKKAEPAKKTQRKQSYFERYWKRKPARKKTTTSSVSGRSKPNQTAKKQQDPNESPIPSQIVAFSGYSKGTIVIDHSDRRLYHVLGGGKAKAYAVGVGKEGFEWTGSNRVSRKAEWPGWTPPPQMIAREKKKGRILPAHMEGGPNNPLGARAMYLGSSYYRIHGTNQPWSLGRAVSSGCIRMANNDVMELYEQVPVGTKVIVRP